MKLRELLPILAVFSVLFATPAWAQEHAHSASEMTYNINFWFGLLEFPFLFLCVFFAFKTASALKGGVFGKGMNLMAWGFLVMAVGHLHMQVDHFFSFNLFNTLLGNIGGSLAWFIALVVTWTLSGLGFYNIYKASKGT